MSGGYFDYDQNRIGSIADSVDQLIATNDCDEPDTFGDPIGRHYRPETIAKFREAVTTLRKAAAMAQRIDWLVSGDDGEDAFHERWAEEVVGPPPVDPYPEVTAMLNRFSPRCTLTTITDAPSGGWPTEPNQ